MYELKIVSHFAAAHQLREYKGACENLHGHNWKIDVYVRGETLGKAGLLMDFKVVKDATKAILEDLDHRFLNETDALSTLNPSSENIARHIFETLSQRLNTGDLKVSKVSAWESENACASYTEP